MVTRTVSLQTADGPMRAVEASPASPRGGVIVIPEAFGLNGYIESVVERLAEAEFHGVAIDPFHRSGGGIAEYGDFETVMKMFAGLETDEQLLADVDAAIDHLREAGFPDQRIGVVGFCFGGRVSFLTVLNRPVGAGVGFYGGGIASKPKIGPFPPLIDGAATLQVPWLGLFGDEDPSIPVDDVERLRAALQRAPVAAEIVRYANAGHGFHCDQRDAYVADAAADAWDRAISWLDHHLR